MRKNLIALIVIPLSTLCGLLIVYFLILPMIPEPPLNTKFESQLVNSYIIGGVIGFILGVIISVGIAKNNRP
jgi:Sec-independent protein secretion pathway component TatC